MEQLKNHTRIEDDDSSLSKNISPWALKASTIANKNDTEIDYQNRRISAHTFLYSKSSVLLFKKIDMRYGIMMQMRFDGYLGFPGGFVEKGEVPVIGLNRELTEECGLDKKYHLTEENYFCSWITKDLVDHFYVKQYSEEDFKAIEKGVMESVDWGGETLGIVRVPVQELQTRSPFANFLSHRYISNAQEQLIESILHEKILTKSEMLRLWDTFKTQQSK